MSPSFHLPDPRSSEASFLPWASPVVCQLLWASFAYAGTFCASPLRLFWRSASYINRCWAGAYPFDSIRTPEKPYPIPKIKPSAMPLQRAVSDSHALVSFRANDDPSVHFRPRPKIKPFPTSPRTYHLSPSLQLRSPKQLLLDWSDDLSAINEFHIPIANMSSQPLEKAKVIFFFFCKMHIPTTQTDSFT